MKRKKQINKKFKLLNRFEKGRIKGGNNDKNKDKDKDKDSNPQGGYPPYQPGGNNDDDKDSFG